MDFTAPQPLTDVLARLDVKTPLGSVMRSADWQAMPQEIRDSAFFSAGVTNAQFLGAQQAGIRDMIARARETNAEGQSMWKMDRSQFVKQLRVMGEALGVAHPDGRKGGVNEKDITDPISIARLKLVVNTQLEMAYGQGQFLAAMDPDILSEWPAWELVRITPKKAPRDWMARWTAAGGTLHDGRMIALKTSPVWSSISRFGKPHPPFDFNSGMGVEEIDVDTAEALGLGHAAAQQPQPVLKPFSAGLKSPVKNLDAGMQKRLQQVSNGKIQIANDEATLAQDAPENDDTVTVRAAKPEPPRQAEKIPTKPVTFKQPPSFEPGKGGGRIEVDAKLAKAIEKAVLNDKPFTKGRPSLDVPLKAQRFIRSFEQSIRGKSLEHAKLYNDLGDEIASKVGSADKVSFPADQCADAVMTHRHPNNTPPGRDDLEALLTAGMREVRAVTDDGVYSLRPGSAGTGMNAYVEAMRAWHALDPAVDAVLSRLHKAHQWTDAEYARRYLQAMYSVLAQRGLISYSYEPFSS